MEGAAQADHNVLGRGHTAALATAMDTGPRLASHDADAAAIAETNNEQPRGALGDSTCSVNPSQQLRAHVVAVAAKRMNAFSITDSICA